MLPVPHPLPLSPLECFRVIIYNFQPANNFTSQASHVYFIILFNCKEAFSGGIKELINLHNLPRKEMLINASMAQLVNLCRMILSVLHMVSQRIASGIQSLLPTGVTHLLKHFLLAFLLSLSNFFQFFTWASWDLSNKLLVHVYLP